MDDYQQNPVLTEAHLTAEEDAESDAKKTRWVLIGIFGNILGILIASVYEPMPPASRLLGKPPEYAALYTDSYKARSRSIQVRHSIIGIALIFALAFVWAVLGP